MLSTRQVDLRSGWYKPWWIQRGQRNEDRPHRRIGVEQRVWNKVTVFGEFDVVDNGGSSNPSFTGGTGNGGCTANFGATVTTKPTSIVKFGFNYLLN